MKKIIGIIYQKFLFSLVLLLLFMESIAFTNSGLHYDKEAQRNYKNCFDNAEMLLKEGNFQNALKAFEQALDLANDYGNIEGCIQCYIRLGLLFWNTGELKESAKFYEKALALARNEEKREYTQECYDALEIYQLYSDGKEYRLSNNYEKSIEAFKKAIGLAKRVGSKAHEVKCLRQLSINYWETNDHKNFLSKNTEALSIARRLNHKKEECQCLNNIGIYHWEQNEYSKALFFYVNSLKIAKIINNSILESTCLNNIGLLYKSIGYHKKAINHFMKALEIDRKIGREGTISVDLNNIGVAYLTRAILYNHKEDFFNAINFFKECNNLAADSGNKRVEVGVLNNLGFVYLNLKEYSESLKYFSVALEKARKIKDLESIGMIYCNLANYYQLSGNLEKAETFYIKAEKISKNIKAANILWEAYFGLGKCCEAQNNKESAIDYYEKSIREIDSVRSRIVFDSFKAGFIRDKIKVYENLINLLYEEEKKTSKNKRDRFFSVMEKAKSRAFLEVLSEVRLTLYRNVSVELRIEEKRTLEKISSILHILSDSSLSNEKRKSIQEEYNQAENEYMLLISKMRSETPEVADMIQPEPCQLAQVQHKLLDDKTAVVEYFLGERQSYMIIIDKNNSFLYRLPSRNEIKKSIKGFIKEISDPPKRKYRGVLAGNRLYSELLKPIEEVLPESIENLVIVPDGFLYFLPFEALRTGGNIFMVEKYVISYAPSCSSLLFLKEKGIKMKHPKSLLAIGDPRYGTEKISISNPKTSSLILKEIYNNQGYDFSPIPYSRKEIKNIAKLFPVNKRDIYLGENAKEEVIKGASLEDYEIIHFACHSLLDEKFPFRSALVLAIDDDDEEDGFLLVREINSLRLSADMIVLSACQTGRGRLENVEGVLGLPRIFFYCGARSVVSSLWKINDKSTTQFMSSFYKHISEGVSKSQALRLAKIKMINSKYSHPFFWASFVLYGESSPLQGIN